ncbi:MAG: hypothetical protein ABIR33_08935 [Pyrinomonadaceae bacterium]
MDVLRILKFLFLGVLAQLLLGFIISLFTDNGEIAIYMPWLYLGEFLLPSGPGGHAMPGDAILGFLVGFITYALLIGYGIDYLIKKRISVKP